MMTTDPISDMLTRIRNASSTNKAETVVPYSKIKHSIAEIMQRSGYLSAVKVTDHGSSKSLTLSLAGSTKAESLQRVSKPGRRIYVKKHEIPSIRNGAGMVILSTPAGIMTGTDAKSKGLGGELICEVY